MKDDFQIEMNEYLPLRDVVFNTLRQAILRGEFSWHSAWESAGPLSGRLSGSWSWKAWF